MNPCFLEQIFLLIILSIRRSHIKIERNFSLVSILINLRVVALFKMLVTIKEY
jgi:hypothetical protein